jgi:hypothetical protein
MRESSILMDGTYKLVLENLSSDKFILQVRNSQATKELCEVLLHGDHSS